MWPAIQGSSFGPTKVGPADAPKIALPHRRQLLFACDIWIDILRVSSAEFRHPCAKREGRKRSEEHTSELQSQFHLVCRLLLEKKQWRYGQLGGAGSRRGFVEWRLKHQSR